MRKLLVTGGAGFIGSNFVHHWLQAHPGERVVVLDALTYAGNLANLDAIASRPELRFVHGNISDTALVETLLRDEGIDTLVHFAAESHVDRSISGPDAFLETNIMGTHSLLKAARQVWLLEGRQSAHRFHHVSTDEVYGSLSATDPAFTENSVYQPNSPYSASKAASDHLVRAYHHTFGLKTTISNCSNNYGPYHFPEKLIPLMIVHLLEGKPLPVYGDGKNVRDWLHVSDHCRGIEQVLLKGTAGETYNIGGRAECENLTLVKSLCAIADAAFKAQPALKSRFPRAPAASGTPSETLINFVTDRPGHDRRYAIDCSKAERELGFAPQTRIEQGLADTFQWYLDQEPWWRALLGARSAVQRGVP
jgi:dTDP-glucose 4,6-dehydratase